MNKFEIIYMLVIENPRKPRSTSTTESRAMTRHVSKIEITNPYRTDGGLPLRTYHSFTHQTTRVTQSNVASHNQSRK